MRDIDNGLRLDVRAEADDVHYRDRAPGQMTLWTEAALQAGMGESGGGEGSDWRIPQR